MGRRQLASSHGLPQANTVRPHLLSVAGGRALSFGIRPPGGVQFGKQQSHSLLPRIRTDGLGSVSTKQLPELCLSLTLPIYNTLLKIMCPFVLKLSDGRYPPGKKIIGIKSKKRKKKELVRFSFLSFILH